MEMDALQKRIAKRTAPWAIFLLACLFIGIESLGAQTLKEDVKITWERVLMDTLVFPHTTPEMQAIYERYAPQLRAEMGAVVGYTTQEMRSYGPESPLSNFAADALLSIARRKYGDESIDFAFTNFGGLRSPFPKGNVTLYDVFSTFPFENALVIVSLKGSHVRQLFEAFAKARPEAVSNVQFHIADHQIASLTINGAPLDENRIYKIATIDFLLAGGDKVTALKDNEHVEFTGITIRDVVLQYIDTFTSHGEPIPSIEDGRVVTDNTQRR